VGGSSPWKQARLVNRAYQEQTLSAMELAGRAMAATGGDREQLRKAALGAIDPVSAPGHLSRYLTVGNYSRRLPAVVAWKRLVLAAAP
jgi:hypothetical protein